MANEAENTKRPANAVELAIQRIYTRDISFEVPNAPAIFSEKWAPQIKLNVKTEVHDIGDDLYDVVLVLTVTAKLEDRTAYICEVEQGGIFKLGKMEPAQVSQITNAYCPNLLFPYISETVSSLITKGSFPQLNLAPINFEAIYANQLKQQQEKK